MADLTDIEFDVLVVEDEPRLRELLCHAIPDMGLPAVGARSAEEAMKLMQERARPLLVLDLNLPGMSGLDFLKVVRERWPQTGVVILTGYGDLDAARQAIHLDVAEFLTKPCPLGDLEKALERARKRFLTARMASRKPALVLPPPYAPMAAETGSATAPQPGGGGSPTAKSPEAAGEAGGAAKTLDDIERQHILTALERHGGNRAAAAAELGISLRTLYYRLSEYQKQGHAVP